MARRKDSRRKAGDFPPGKEARAAAAVPAAQSSRQSCKESAQAEITHASSRTLVAPYWSSTAGASPPERQTARKLEIDKTRMPPQAAKKAQRHCGSDFCESGETPKRARSTEKARQTSLETATLRQRKTRKPPATR